VSRNRAPSAQTFTVLRALAADPSRWRYGYELGAEVDLRSGSLYPILMRLSDRGLLESAWQETERGRPPRHVYRLTAAGVAEVARLEPAPAVRHRSPAPRRQLGGTR
jgi:PadR family transcriptional regulator PadR